ncbi:MAG: hypothetical protein JWN37_763 [Candidatus Nomurabacteria bacterium]|nr:hypothetical protein [Candidatus Nomurabacteria bacterium]
MRIAVTGPQNTGKTSFIEDFLKEFPNYQTPEKTHRDIVKEKGLNINQLTTLETQKEIRDYLFEQMRQNTEHNVIFDRCMVDNYVYTYVQYEAGNIPKWFVDETETFLKDTLQTVDMYLFIPTALSVPLVNKGTRDLDKSYIDNVNNNFLKVLFDLARKNNITIKVISGSREERIAQVRKLI